MALIALMATACSDGGGNDGQGTDSDKESDPEAPTMSQRIGVVRLASRSPAIVPAVAANFFDVDEAAPVPLAELRAQLMPAPGECRLESDAPRPIRDGVSGLDAGEVLTFTDANGTYASVERSGTAEEGFVYLSARGLTGPGSVSASEGDIMFDIPGGDTPDAPIFPAASAVAFPTVQGTPMLREPLAQTQVFPDSVYRWDVAETAQAGEHAFVLLMVNSVDVITNSVLCALPEGDEFVLPEATVEALRSRNEIGSDDAIGSVFGFGAMRLEERTIDERTLLLMRNMRFVELPRP